MIVRWAVLADAAETARVEHTGQVVDKLEAHVHSRAVDPHRFALLIKGLAENGRDAVAHPTRLVVLDGMHVDRSAHAGACDVLDSGIDRATGRQIAPHLLYPARHVLMRDAAIPERLSKCHGPSLSPRPSPRCLCGVPCR